MAIGVTITTNSTLYEIVKIQVVKGNELTDIVMEAIDAADFPQSEWEAPVNSVTAAGTTTVHVSKVGMYDKVNAVRMSHQLAALGARGDYFLITGIGKLRGTTTSATDLRNQAVEVLDYSGVPVAVQHAIFGKYSPFVTPTQPVSEGMIKGIDRQKIMAAYNVVAAADATYLNQLVRGSASSRVQHQMTDYTGGSAAAVDTHILKIKPEADGVFVLPRNGLIWYGDGPAATRTYVDASS